MSSERSFKIVVGAGTAVLLVVSLLIAHPGSTYRFAFLFLVPMLWAVYALREKLGQRFRAGNGVVYVYHSDAAAANVNGDKGAIEFAPEAAKERLSLWPNPGSDFPVMQKIKQLFDPQRLLNRGRLYGRI